MGRTACLQHPENEPMIVLHKWQSDMFEDACIGSLIAYFQYWHEIKLAHLPQAQRYNQVADQHGDEPTQDESLLQYHSQDEIEADLLRIAKKSKIKQGVDVLVSVGILSKHKNPVERYSFDRTTYYLFHVEVLKDFLEARKFAKQEWLYMTGGQGIFDYTWVEYDSRLVKSDSPSVISDSPSLESNRTITENTSETSTENTSEVTSEDEDATQQPVEIPNLKQNKRDVASQNKTRKTKPKPPVLTEDQVQAFIDLYHQEKPVKWKPVIAPKDITPALTRNLGLLVQEYGEDSMDKLRKALIVARTHKFWSDCEMKLEWIYRKPHHNINNPNKIAIILDTMSDADLDRLDSPIAAHIQTPQDDKRARILERTARVAFNQPQGVVA